MPNCVFSYPVIKIANYHSFKAVLLPDVEKLKNNNINSKLQSSVTISLIVDFWTNHQPTSSLWRQNEPCFVLNIIQMPGRHTADNVKLAIEKIINDKKFDFDKSKILSKSLSRNI
jgi:hypothetical protein